MPYLTPKHLFYFLMILSGAAFIVPPHYVPRIGSPSALFSLVSWPSGKIAHWGHDALAGPDLSTDERSADVVKRENEVLKNELSAANTRVSYLEQREISREKVGDIRQWCTPFVVSSTDSGTHASLGIQGASWGGLRNGMYVIYDGGIVGQVEGAGITGARVRLITDQGFNLRVSFARFDGAKEITLREPAQTLAEGTGRGAMVIRLLPRDVVAKTHLQVNDIVKLNEPEWPSYLQGRRLGTVRSIGVRPDSPQQSQIVIEPDKNLLRLSEVLIVTRPPEAQSPGAE